ncbi:MAG: NAD(P)/FAD-dependent oxidoreductase [Clostridiales bacterium]|jgi:dihydrolipoamide dehydrogenase|nr:NAD(P)/FAD-dependent oxidoreductase [Clostridiales bacterium]
MKKYDVAVIGGGPGGYTAALKCVKGGKSVVLFEKKDLGGTCLNRGCIPTKSALNMAKNYFHLKNADDYIICSEPKFDFFAAAKKRDAAVNKIRANLTRYLVQSGISIVNERAVIIEDGTILAGGETYGADNVIIASGGVCAKYDIDGIEFAYSSDRLTTETVTDEDIVIVGGGVVGLEFAIFYSMTGSRVAMIMMEEKPLITYDKDIAQALSIMLKKKGITLITNSAVIRVKKEESGYSVLYKSKDGESKTISCGLAIDASGRRPDIDAESLDAVGIKYDDKGIFTDENFRTNIRGIFAVGDVVRGNIRLAHKAMFDGEQAAESILNPEAKSKTAVVPICIYTLPEISCAGMTTEDCINAGASYLSAKAMMGANGKAVACDSETGFVKVLFAKITDKSKAFAGVPYIEEKKDVYRLVGAHIVSDNSSEIIGGLAALISMGATREDILGTIFPHPSLSESFMDAVKAVVGD